MAGKADLTKLSERGTNGPLFVLASLAQTPILCHFRNGDAHRGHKHKDSSCTVAIGL